MAWRRQTVFVSQVGEMRILHPIFKVEHAGFRSRQRHIRDIAPRADDNLTYRIDLSYGI